MPSADLPPIALFGIRGRWGTSQPFSCPPDQCIEAVNVDWFRSSLARKRGGAANVALTGGTALTGVVSHLTSYVPNYDQGLRELFAVDDAAGPRFKRLAGGTAWADVTGVDSVTSRAMDINSCAFNGNMYFFYDSAVNRAHVWDPTDATIRRTSLGTPAAATVANTGGGTYAATIRYYKVAYAVKAGAVIRYRSQLSPAVSFTPSGAGTAARVTKPATIGESETHWLIYGSPDGSNYVLLTTLVVATTTYDDSATPSLYTGTAAPDPNAFTPIPSVRFGVADGGQMVVGGAWETVAGDAMTPSHRRAWWTSPLTSTDEGDAERISNTSTIKSYTDFDEALTGLSSPQQGSVYVFAYNAMWKLVSSGVYTAPYTWYRITGAKGCIDHKTIISAQDESGAPCTYWISPQGPCRMGVSGQFSMVEDIADIWDTVNLSATNVVAHGVYHRDKHQIWWWVATGSSNDPDTKIVFDVDLGRVIESGKVRRGWAKHTGPSAAARCSCMMSNTLGANMSRDLKPYIGLSTGTAVWKCDTGTSDAGTAFQAYITSRPYSPWGFGKVGGMVDEAVLSAEAATGIQITLDIIKNLGEQPLRSRAMLSPTGAETHVFPKFTQSKVAEADMLQFTVGDGAAVAGAWNLSAITVPVTVQGTR